MVTTRAQARKLQEQSKTSPITIPSFKKYVYGYKAFHRVGNDLQCKSFKFKDPKHLNTYHDPKTSSKKPYIRSTGFHYSSFPPCVNVFYANNSDNLIYWRVRSDEERTSRVSPIEHLKKAPQLCATSLLSSSSIQLIGEPITSDEWKHSLGNFFITDLCGNTYSFHENTLFAINGYPVPIDNIVFNSNDYSNHAYDNTLLEMFTPLFLQSTHGSFTKDFIANRAFMDRDIGQGSPEQWRKIYDSLKFKVVFDNYLTTLLDPTMEELKQNLADDPSHDIEDYKKDFSGCFCGFCR
jgi:hypothetical protein